MPLAACDRAMALEPGRAEVLGRTEDAVRELQRAISLRPNDGNTLYNATCVYGVLGQHEDALDMLERALKAGYANYDSVRRDPDLAALRENPRFVALVGEAGG